MKTAISVPDELFAQAERLAHREGRSRSDVYSAALREYVAKHSVDEVTQALDRTVQALGKGAEADPFVAAASARVLQGDEW